MPTLRHCGLNLDLFVSETKMSWCLSDTIDLFTLSQSTTHTLHSIVCYLLNLHKFNLLYNSVRRPEFANFPPQKRIEQAEQVLTTLKLPVQYMVSSSVLKCPDVCGFAFVCANFTLAFSCKTACESQFFNNQVRAASLYVGKCLLHLIKNML